VRRAECWASLIPRLGYTSFFPALRFIVSLCIHLPDLHGFLLSCVGELQRGVG